MKTLDTIFDYFKEPRALNNPVEVTEEVYWYFLEILPPIYLAGGFAVPEAVSEDTYSCYFKRGDQYFHEYRELRR